MPINTSTATFNTVAGLKTALTLSAASSANSLSFSAAGGANAYTFDTAGTANNNVLTLTTGIINLDAASQTFYNAFTLAGSQSWTATSGAMNFNGNVNLGAGANSYTLTVNGASPVAIAGVIANGGAPAGNLVYAGTGTLTLTGPNTYTGTTNVNSGTLSIQSAGALGSGAGNTTVASGATLQMANNITTTNTGTLTINGTGSAGSGGALTNASGSNFWNSDITFGSNSTIYSSVAGQTLTLGNAAATSLFTMGANTVTIDGPGNTFIYSNVGVAGDTGSVIKNGTGTLTYFGYNTYYTGATTVNAGSLLLQVGPFNAGYYGIMGPLTIGTGPSNPALAGTVSVAIASNSYANQISPASAVTINSDGILTVGAATGLGSLTLNGGQVSMASGIAITPTGAITSNTNSAHETSLISGGQVTLSGAGTITVARDATLTSDLTVSSTIAGGSIVKQGAGVLTLTAANTLTGTTINAGTINTQATNALGATNGVTVASGATLQLQNGITLGQSSTTFSGTGTSNNGAIENVSGANTVSGPVTLAGNSLIQSDAGTVTLGNTVNLGSGASGYNLDVGGSGNTTISGVIQNGGTGAGSLTKDGAGTLLLSGPNTFTGGITLNAGTAQVSTDQNLGGANNITFSGGTLEATNSFTVGSSASHTLVINGSGDTLKIDAGFTLTLATANQLTGAGTLTLNGAGTLAINANQAAFTGILNIASGVVQLGAAQTAFGTIDLSGGTLNLNGKNLTSSMIEVSGTTSIIEFGSGASLASILTATTLKMDAGSVLTIKNWNDEVEYIYTANLENGAGTLATFGATGGAPENQVVFNGFAGNSTKWLSSDHEITPVPEPATCGAIFTAAALGLFFWFRLKASAARPVPVRMAVRY